MTITDMARQKGFIVTVELTPPKGASCEDLLRAAAELSQCVDALNVTDGQSAMMRMGSLSVCHLLMDRGIEPVFQLTCRDRNRIALQSELLNAASLGIRNVLCLTGDHVALGDHPDAKQVFDLDSVSLLWGVQKLNNGVDLQGNPLTCPTDLCAGAVVNPNASPMESQLLKMERKIEAGARFFQTQAVFDVSQLEPLVKITQKREIPVFAGVLVLRTARMARYVMENVSGMSVPEKLVTDLEKSKDSIQRGVEIAAKIALEAKDVCQGVHIMTAGREDLVRRVLDRAGILGSES
jgi:5,10-methylenetetrahydrofolate reductase